MQLLRTVRVEREALAGNIASERAGLTVAFDDQRAKIAAAAAQSFLVGRRAKR